MSAFLQFTQTLSEHLDVLAAPTPSSGPEPVSLKTSNILDFLVKYIVPILLAGLGIIFLGRASKGDVSRVMTSSAVALIGLVFIGGATTLFFFGGSLINVLFG